MYTKEDWLVLLKEFHPAGPLNVLVALVLINIVSSLFFLFFRRPAMGKGCITVTKYFLFLFNLLFFVSNWVYSSVILVAIIWFLLQMYVYFMYYFNEPSDTVLFLSFIFYVAPRVSDDAESIDPTRCKTRFKADVCSLFPPSLHQCQHKRWGLRLAQTP